MSGQREKGRGRSEQQIRLQLQAASRYARPINPRVPTRSAALATASLSLHRLNLEAILKLAIGEKIGLCARRCHADNCKANGQELSESGILGHTNFLLWCCWLDLRKRVNTRKSHSR